MSDLKLWLIRHAETDLNRGLWTSEPAETPLTPLGREQAKQIAANIPEQADLLIVSPLRRAKETAEFLLNRWPNLQTQTWPIEEFHYLSPYRLQKLNAEARKEAIRLYWQKNDPYYVDEMNTESFASFLQRVAAFHTAILKQRGFVIVLGHGQFLKAYQLGLDCGFSLNSEWMPLFRQKETANPLQNGEIVKLDFNF